MEKARFNFAWAMAIIALIAYSYISFMGLVYLNIFNVFTSALVTIGFDALIVFFIYMMCIAKHSRWVRLGVLGQFSFGLVVLVLLLGSSIMFSHFTRIVSRQEDLSETYKAAILDAANLDGKYQDYVKDRCMKYGASLKGLSPSSSEYKAIFSNSLDLGFSKITIVDKCCTTLGNLLRGSKEKGDILSKRDKWLENETASVWNLNLPKNIRDIEGTVNQWIDNYKELSAQVYVGEIDVSPFEDFSFNENTKKLKDLCTAISLPTVLGVLLALICFALILLPWITTPKNIASMGSNTEYTIDMPDE